MAMGVRLGMMMMPVVMAVIRGRPSGSSGATERGDRRGLAPGEHEAEERNPAKEMSST